jgi:hypothetical protein
MEKPVIELRPAAPGERPSLQKLVSQEIAATTLQIMELEAHVRLLRAFEPEEQQPQFAHIP